MLIPALCIRAVLRSARKHNRRLLPRLQLFAAAAARTKTAPNPLPRCGFPPALRAQAARASKIDAFSRASTFSLLPPAAQKDRTRSPLLPRGARGFSRRRAF